MVPSVAIANSISSQPPDRECVGSATEPVAAIAAVTSSATRPVNGALPIAEVLERHPASERLPLANLPGRDLDTEELRELAAGIAADPGLWSQHVAFSDDERHYVSLYRDTHVDVWVLCWTPQNDTGWHDHDISAGAIAVTSGCLTEHNLAVHEPSMSTAVNAGLVFAFGPDHIHRLTGRDPGSVSIHAYSPPLWRMGQYTVADSGMLRRRSVSYADELRPLVDIAS
jgi:hypothetical protein